MLDLLKKFHKEDSGQDTLEYVLIGLIVAIGAIAGMGTLASSVNNEFKNLAAKLT